MEKRLFETEFEALIACRNHWQWLEITESTTKRNYRPSLGWVMECACCEFVTNKRDTTLKDDCVEICPMTNFAWQTGCSSDRNSFYVKWLFVS